MMNQPRCGNKDRNGISEEARRRRYALQGNVLFLNLNDKKILLNSINSD